MKPYPIAFTIDKNYVLPLCVTLTSFYKNNAYDQFKIYVIHDDLTQIDKSIILKSVSNITADIEFIDIDTSVFTRYKTGHHFTKAIFYRLLIPEIFKNRYEKVLYLDSDALILAEISELFKTDIKDYYLAAVGNVEYKGNLSEFIDISFGYFASGTLLFNVEMWNSDSIKSRIFCCLDSNKLDLPDQDALNIVINGKWINLDISYGIETSLIDAIARGDHLQYSTCIKFPKIVHFSGSSKPWHLNNNHMYKHEFYKYLKSSPIYPFISTYLIFASAFHRYFSS